MWVSFKYKSIIIASFQDKNRELYNIIKEFDMVNITNNIQQNKVSITKNSPNGLLIDWSEEYDVIFKE